MKRYNSGNDSSSSRQWRRMRIDVALKTEVIARCRLRSDAEWCEWREWRSLVKL